ncbi:MAG: GTPase HflX [Paludibacter sp.]|nr:GTPase HflX [Paludibacter sp.]
MQKQDTQIMFPQAVLVGLITPEQSERQTQEYIEELKFLSHTAGITPQKVFIQRVEYPNTNTFVGPGKLDEICNYIIDKEIDFAIFDDELSPKQLRNIERILKIKILDRTNLILDIFAQRAQTASAKTQVELATLQYMLPRLSRLWGHLDRQRGGGITSRGMGEKQIEADQRIIRQRITLLKQQLKDIDRQMATQRNNRGKLVRAALVGYTNVGKSTLMNILSKSEVFAENKLFATLDTTVRKVIIENLPFLLTDTVGFIRKLPHNLIESFKSTLDEVRQADLLLHVVDISHPAFEEQMLVVNQTLKDILNEEKPEIVIFNKIDAFSFIQKEEDDLTPPTAENISLEELKRTYFNRLHDNCVFVSATEKNNIDELKNILYQKVKEIHVERYPYNDFLFQKFD